MLDNTMTRSGDDGDYIGRLSHDNPSYESVTVGAYFVYDRYNSLCNWSGYQVGIKVSLQHMIPVNLPFTKLHEAISYCNVCNRMNKK